MSEDLDLGLRVFLLGWRARLLLTPPVMGELPESAQDWQVQQNRWSSGFLQVARKLLPALWRSSLGKEAKISTSLMILMQLVFPSLLLAGITVTIGALLRGSFAHYAPAIAVGAIMGFGILLGITWPAYKFLRRGTFRHYLAIVMSMPILILYLAATNSVGIIGTALGRQRVFVVTPKRGR